MTSKGPAHQNSIFGVGKWSPKLHSMFPRAGDPKVIVAGTSKHIFWNYSNLNSTWSISESTFLKLLQLNIRRMVPSHRHILLLAVGPHSACSQSQIPRCTSQEHLHQRVPNIQGQHHGGVCFTHSLCFIPVIFITNINTPRIHKLLKLPQLNLSDAITQAHSITFLHGLTVIRSILFRDYFTRSS